MGWLELRIPPPVVALLFGLFMWFASSLVAPVEIPFGYRAVVAAVQVCVGVAVGFAAVFQFLRARTTVNPTRPGATSSLVAGGCEA